MIPLNNNDKPIGVLKIKPKGKKFIVTFDKEELERKEKINDSNLKDAKKVEAKEVKNVD